MYTYRDLSPVYQAKPEQDKYKDEVILGKKEAGYSDKFRPVFDVIDDYNEGSYYDVVIGDYQNTLVRLEYVTDAEAIKNSLRNIFIIQKNTLPGKPWFGNPLETEVFELFGSVTEATAFSAVENAISKYEPRVTLNDLKVTFAPELNRIVVDLHYSFVQDSNVFYDNLLMPFSHNNFTYLDGRGTTIINTKTSTPNTSNSQ